VTLGHHPRFGLSVGGEDDEIVHDLGGHAGRAVALTHAVQLVTVAAHDRVGVPHGGALGRLGGDRLRLGAWPRAVEPLIGEVGEVHRVAVDGVTEAAVLVNEGSGGELGTEDVLDRVVSPPSDDDRATTLGGPRLGPVDVVAGDDRIPQPDHVR
jgi:hypothetical protein